MDWEKYYTGKHAGEIYLLRKEESDFETFVFLALQSLGKAFDDLDAKIDTIGDSIYPGGSDGHLRYKKILSFGTNKCHRCGSIECDVTKSGHFLLWRCRLCGVTWKTPVVDDKVEG